MAQESNFKVFQQQPPQTQQSGQSQEQTQQQGQDGQIQDGKPVIKARGGYYGGYYGKGYGGYGGYGGYRPCLYYGGYGGYGGGYGYGGYGKGYGCGSYYGGYGYGGYGGYGRTSSVENPLPYYTAYFQEAITVATIHMVRSMTLMSLLFIYSRWLLRRWLRWFGSVEKEFVQKRPGLLLFDL